MPKILLTAWAKINGIKPMDAKNMARRGKIKTTLEPYETKRLMIEETEKPPSKR